VPAVISTVIFDYGGVISSPLFIGIGAFEESEGFAKGSLLELLFGDTQYIGVEGRAVAAEVASSTVDAVAADPDAAAAEGEVRDEPDWHLLEKGRIDVATYFERMVEKAPAILGKPLDMDAYGRFWRSTAPGVHWMVVHKMQELKARGVRVGLLTNNVKEFGEHWRSSFPIEVCDDVVDSSHVGMRKPEREIYALTCERLGIEPDEAVFVDDNAENVAAARAFGMEAVHFGDQPWDSLAELDAILERRGVTPRG
jgi:putative hydrolase of the HAD superfamily